MTKTKRFAALPFLLAGLFLFATEVCQAADSTSASRPFSNRLLGDWGGARTKAATNGFDFFLESTHYYQGMLSGTGDKSFEYGGRLDFLGSFDTEKMHLWKGGQIRLHAEHFYGNLGPSYKGFLLPSNLGMMLPLDSDGTVSVSSLHIIQKLGDRVSLRLGKINTVDFLENDLFFGGHGASRFMNVAFAAPPNGLLPPSIIGAVVNVRTEPLVWSLMVYDPKDHTHDFFPAGLFSSGVNVALGATWMGKFSGRTTSITLNGIYSTKEGLDLEEVLLPPSLRTSNKKGSWHVGLALSHLLKENPERPGQGWGIFAKAGLSDGNPNPFERFFTGGIGGKGLFKNRPDDSFGLGYFKYSFSNDLENALSSLAQYTDESGYEVYYKYALTPWLSVTADLQYLRPTYASNDRAYIGGIRVNILF